MRKKRVCDYIAEAVQNEILSGRMEKGMPLRQEELAEQLGYSRIPIREALQILESQGLAKRLATRHVVVADVSNQVIRENFDLFFDVELMTLENMQKKAVLWQETVLQENAEEAFHQFLIENSTNEYFVRILENALDCYIRFATEETKAGLEKEKRLQQIVAVKGAYQKQNRADMKKALREYFDELTCAVTEERSLVG